MKKNKQKHIHDDLFDNLPSDETKQHILNAGREILLAAQGALRFCKSYTEGNKSNANPLLLSFFERAINVADELGGSISKVVPIKDAASGIAKSVMQRMEAEMHYQKSRPSTKKKTTKKKTAKKKTAKKKS